MDKTFETKLKAIFEFQKFAQNEHLDKIIQNGNQNFQLNDDILLCVIGGINESDSKKQDVE